MENENAPALLSRALGLKKIDDLTKLIRELVLEPSAIRSEAAKIIDEFQDLAAIHEQAADARKQLTHLEPLPGLQAKIAQAGEAIHQLNSVATFPPTSPAAVPDSLHKKPKNFQAASTPSSDKSMIPSAPSPMHNTPKSSVTPNISMPAAVGCKP